MRISFGSWAFAFGPYSRSPVPFRQVASHLSEAGYDGIEIAGFPPHITLEDYASAASRRDLTAMLADLKLAVSGFVPDFTFVNPLVPSNRDRYLDLFQRNLELCVGLNSPRMRVDSIAAPGSLNGAEYREAMDRLASIWSEAAGLAQKSGVRLAWEFEPGFIFNKPSEVVDVYEQVGHPNFQVLFDVCHAYVCGVVGARQHGAPETLASVDQFLNLLAGRVGHIHVNDADGTLYCDETSAHRPFGQGVIDYARLAPKLKALPGVDWWCVDLAFCPNGWNLVKPSLDFLRRL